MNEQRTATTTKTNATQYEKRREYFKEYRRKNPDKAKKWQEAYILARAERIKAARAAQQAATDGQEGP